MNKKLQRVIIACVIVILVGVISACSRADNGADDLNEGKLTVVTSLYPLYDFTQKIGGEHVRVVQLVPFGVDPHDWTPKLRDITNITEADVFVYNGAGFEVWIDSILESVDMDGIVVEASDGIALIEAGHAAADEHDHDHEQNDHHHDHDHHHGAYDPHVWTSPKQAMTLAKNILSALIQSDPEHEAVYEANYNELINRLEGLDQQFHEVVENGHRNKIVVTHQSFAYLARDYHFQQIAVMGLSPQAEPTVKDLQRISEFIQRHGIQYILFEELVSPKLAETLAADLKIDTLVLNPLEGLTEEQQAEGEDYFSVMEKNIETLRIALQE